LKKNILISRIKLITQGSGTYGDVPGSRVSNQSLLWQIREEGRTHETHWINWTVRTALWILFPNNKEKNPNLEAPARRLCLLMIEEMKTLMLAKLLKGDAVLSTELLALLDSRKKAVPISKEIFKDKDWMF